MLTSTPFAHTHAPGFEPGPTVLETVMLAITPSVYSFSSYTGQESNPYDPLRRRGCFHYITSACGQSRIRTCIARPFKPPLYHWSYLSMSLLQCLKLILLITSQAHHHRCLGGAHVFSAGTGWIEHPARGLTGRYSATELCSQIAVPNGSRTHTFLIDSEAHWPLCYGTIADAAGFEPATPAFVERRSSR